MGRTLLPSRRAGQTELHFGTFAEKVKTPWSFDIPPLMSLDVPCCLWMPVGALQHATHPL